MDIQIKYKDGSPIGWSIKGETEEEKNKINTIRNLQFFGMDDTKIVYDGRTESDDKNNDVGRLHYIQKGHQKVK